MSKPVIELKKVFKTYGEGLAKNEVLKDINLEIYPGEYIVLFGPSGSGKSTLLYLLAGLEMASKGSVLIRGKIIAHMKTKEIVRHRAISIGMIFQSFNVIKSLNVLYNIALPQLLVGESRRRATNRAHKLLRMFKMEKFHNFIPTQLSGGQQQRVAIMRSLANNPWILICDEPTGNLDTKNADEVMTLIEELNLKSRRTVILVTHNPDYMKYANRVFHVKDGQIDRVEEIRPFVRHQGKEEMPKEITLK